MGTRQDTALVVNALAMAVTRRQPEDNSTILHSDYAEVGVKPRNPGPGLVGRGVLTGSPA
jgi:hypothetical protein